MKKMRVHLQTLTPLHIGGSEGSLSPLEFAYCDEKVYVISSERWASWLSHNKALDEFVRSFRDGRVTSLQAYLKNRGLLKPESLGAIARYTVQSASAPRGDLRAFIRNGYQQPYMPGSSIKGILRLSMVYVLFTKLAREKKEELLDRYVEEQLKEFQEKLESERLILERRISNRQALDKKLHKVKRRLQEKYKRSFTDMIDGKLLRDFKISEYWAKTDAHSDIFRVLEVCDCKPFERDALKVEEIKIHSAGASVKPYSIFAECLPPGIEFTVDVNIDLDLLALFKRNNPQMAYGLGFSEVESALLNPFGIAKTLTQRLLTHERTFLEQELKVSGALSFAEEPDVRLGWGGGMLATTVDLLLDERLRKQIRNLLFAPKGESPAPKTRRLTTSNQPLGWCKIVRQEVL